MPWGPNIASSMVPTAPALDRQARPGRNTIALVVATHSGPFHADDVMAWALLKTFVDPDASLVRTRDPARIDQADIVVDVGGVYDPYTRRFDHHQASYTGPLSSAGMVLAWLIDTGVIDEELGRRLREGGISYIDDVDNGRVAPRPEVPCFPRIVQAMVHPAVDDEGFDRAFRRAGEFAAAWLHGAVVELERIREARVVVIAAMNAAAEAGRNVLYFDAYLKWQEPYFGHDGANHPTEFTLFPGTDGSWRIVAIPPRLGDFAQKRSLPESWAGLTDDALEAVTGIAGSRFCHKNRFIAVFETREAALEAMEQWNLLWRPERPEEPGVNKAAERP